MWPDGICRVTDTRYTKTIQYQDINYQLSQNEDKTAIFEAWCDFLNYFDSSVQFQLSFVNLSASQETFARSISIPPCGDEFDGIRAEYAGMLQNQLARGNNGLIKTKYLTFGVEADNLRAAKPRLERIETDLLNNFKRLGVVAAPLNGFERLHVMHDILRMDEQEPFRFSWDWLPPSGLSTKDFIAPSSFEFKTGRMFRMGKKLGAISFVQILAPELNDRMLADFLDMESSVLVNLHVQSVDQVNAIKTVKRKITDLDKSKIEEQKKAVRAGYDMDIIPSDLATYGAEAKKLLQDLQSRNERMFLLTFLILNTADTPRQLDNNIFQTSSIAQKYNCALTRLDFQQEEGLMSSLPLGLNQIEIQRGLTTSSVAIFVPFTTQELFQTGSEALYYGINALSNNLIMVDRKLLKNPNGLILGTPGSGKSFSAKREITNAFLICPKDDIIICDPEGEYTPLVERLHGQVIKLSPTGKGYDGSPCYINPMDLNLDYSDDDNPLSLKSDFILSLCELIVGGKDGLAPVEKTIIDRCVRIVYRDYLNDPKPENMPLLEDLYNALRAQDEKEAQYIATALEIYADYIATRPRAERIGSHGLFTEEGVQVNLAKVSRELNLHDGNVWTAIISLRREDAERLGYNTGERWRQMLRAQSQELSDQLHIPMQDLKWFAAFHNEGHHPHVHLMLKEHNVDVYFEEQGIHSLQPGAEFYITIYGSIAQSESENISANVRWGKAQSAKEGNVPFHYKRFLGYRRGSDGKPEIDPEQAVTVKRIYERFLAGDSLATIASDLNADGIPTPSGVGQWQRGTIESILTNEKYKGDAVLNKTYIRDCLSKKVMINNGERPKYYVENNHPAIIDSGTFGRVQEEMARRSGKRKVKQVGTKTEQGRYSSKYALTELLICGECGTPYRRCTWAANGKKKVVWRCINRLDYGKKYCHDSPSIEESVLQEAIMKAVMQTARQNAEVLKTLKLHIGMGLSAETTEDNSLDLQIRIAEIEAEFQKMLKAIAADNVEAFDEEKAKALMDEKAKLQIQLDRIADTKQKRKNAKSRLDEIFTIIEALANHPISYDDQIVRQILESVIVESKEKIKVVFVGGLEVTQTM